MYLFLFYLYTSPDSLGQFMYLGRLSCLALPQMVRSSHELHCNKCFAQRNRRGKRRAISVGNVIPFHLRDSHWVQKSTSLQVTVMAPEPLSLV